MCLVYKRARKFIYNYRFEAFVWAITLSLKSAIVYKLITLISSAAPMVSLWFAYYLILASFVLMSFNF